MVLLALRSAVFGRWRKLFHGKEIFLITSWEGCFPTLHVLNIFFDRR